MHMCILGYVIEEIVLLTCAVSDVIEEAYVQVCFKLIDACLNAPGHATGARFYLHCQWS